MTVPQDLTLVCIIRLNTGLLPENARVGKLPDAISAAITQITGGGCVNEKYYVVKDFTVVRSAVNALAEPFEEVVATELAAEVPRGTLLN